MCGICGVFYSDKDRNVSRPVLEAMTQILAHRGPDDAGIFVNGSIGLGHRRLSVIDLKGGHQPLSDSQGQYWITFNGEIYNFKEIRKNLEAQGCAFKTQTDTEVILQAYRVMGVDCLNLFRGMFAFAIWDGPKRRLFLARDRLGKKSLYYYFKDGVFLFASELKSFLKYPDLDLHINLGAVKEFLTYQYIPSPETIYREISKLPPAHYLVLENQNVSLKKYWSASWDAKKEGTEETLVLEGMESLLESVHLRLRSDVPLGVFLSGGLDSSAIVALMSQGLSQPLKTFSVSFAGSADNETFYAREVAASFGTEHHEIEIHPCVMESLEKWVWHFDEPFGDSSALPTYWMAQEAKKIVTVVLSGDGGDECFGGYERYTQKLMFDRCFKLFPKWLAMYDGATQKEWPSNRSGRLAKEMRWLAGLKPKERYDHWMRIYREPLLSNLLEENLRKENFSILNEVDETLHPMDQMMKSDFETYLPDCLMVKVDRASMAHGLEVRSPFLDHEIVEFCARLPPSLKMKGFQKKILLKKMMKAGLPSSILNRKKQGFTVPLNQWFRTELKSFAYDILLSTKALNRGYVQSQAVKRLLDDHMQEKDQHGHRIWLLLILELWHRTFWDVRT